MSKAITAKDIADLRARTGAGMMDCKKALEEGEGDHLGSCGAHDLDQGGHLVVEMHVRA